MVVQDTNLSGISCPCGQAELTQVSLERQQCSACGRQITEEEAARLRQRARHARELLRKHRTD